MDEIRKLLENAARFVSVRDMPRFTRYLDPAQEIEARGIARAYGVGFSAFGGYDAAERMIGCFHPLDDAPSKEAYPIVCLCARIPVKFCHITHRDVLGAFMSLGLTRDCIGDMIILQDCVYLFAHDQTADFVASALTSAGKAPLRFEAMNEFPVIPEPAGTELKTVVSSLRLDAVLAGAYRLSRNEAAEAIRAGLVKVNHLPCDRTDMQLKEDSLLSLKGYGRIRFKSVSGTTRKERIGIILFRYE